jgi:CheY-like chemotaxis protein
VNLVLIVEDDGDFAQLLADVVEAGGHRAAVARNGHEALEYLRNGNRPTVILLDLAMPVMDGWEFRREQQKLPEIAAIPVVVLTAEEDARQKAAAIHAQGHLGKPVSVEELLGEVDRLCEPADAQAAT